MLAEASRLKPDVIVVDISMPLLNGLDVAGGGQSLTAHFKSGAAIIPPPPASIAAWPVIGTPLKNAWLLASRDLSELLKGLAPQVKSAIPGVVSATADLGSTVLQLLLSIIVSGVLLANAQAA